MRLWHYKLIPYLPTSQLLAQWRELHSIYKKQDRHILINYIYEYSVIDLWNFSYLVSNEMVKRGIKVDYTKADAFFTSENCTKLKDVNVRGVVHCYQNHHNDRYLLQCFYNLQEKYDRGQQDFSKECYEKLLNFVTQYLLQKV